jgi:hypothetical protein
MSRSRPVTQNAGRHRPASQEKAMIRIAAPIVVGLTLIGAGILSGCHHDHARWRESCARAESAATHAAPAATAPATKDAAPSATPAPAASEAPAAKDAPPSSDAPEQK